jgi:ABC-type molybdenum transport system ATPase subunit/photorepair protein PhrA
MATAAPKRASHGETKNQPAKKANRKPAKEPSTLLSLLKGNVVREKYLPKIEAVLSPNAKIAIAALLNGAGKRTKVSRIPTAK